MNNYFNPSAFCNFATGQIPLQGYYPGSDHTGASYAPGNFPIGLSTSHRTTVFEHRGSSATAMEVPCDTAEEDDCFEEKQLAYKRFKRNDALMNRIMSPEIVCPWAPIMNSKLNSMRAQVTSLERCLHKENAELAKLKHKNASVRADLLGKQAAFEKTYRKLSRPITDAQISKFSNYIYDRFHQKRLERLKFEEAEDGLLMEPTCEDKGNKLQEPSNHNE